MADFTFFLSYARDNGNSYLDQFLEDLTERVRGRMGLLKSDPVLFRDAEEIQLGQPWSNRLIEGLQNSRVLLSLYTPLYFKRPVCGQELGFFQRRAELHDDQNVSFVLPLLWIPCEECIPTPLQKLNFLHKDFPASYREKGMETLTRQSSGRFRNDYDQAVEAIMEQIFEAARRKPALPPLPALPSLSDIPNAFLVGGEPEIREYVTAMQAKGPNAVGFVYVAGTKTQLQRKQNKSPYGDYRPAEWCPFTSRKRMIGALAPEIAAARNFLISPLALDRNIADHIKAVENDNSILVLIVDTWTLHLLPEYEEWMSRFDKVPSLHTSVIVVWNEDDLDSKQYETLLKNQISQTFATQSTREEIFFRPLIRNSTEFESALADTLIRLQDKIIQNKQTQQAVAESPFRTKPEVVNS